MLLHLKSSHDLGLGPLPQVISFSHLSVPLPQVYLLAEYLTVRLALPPNSFASLPAPSLVRAHLDRTLPSTRGFLPPFPIHFLDLIRSCHAQSRRLPCTGQDTPRCLPAFPRPSDLLVLPNLTNLIPSSQLHLKLPLHCIPTRQARTLHQQAIATAAGAMQPRVATHVQARNVSADGFRA